MTPINLFLLGALAMASGVAGTYFLRFWRRTRDRLFALFAVAFWLMGLNWILLAFVGRDEARYAGLYVLRLAAFVMILFGILDKNRARPHQ